MPENLSVEEQARYLFLAAPAVLSHDRVLLPDGKFDNVYNFGNCTALHYFERTFEQLTTVPSTNTCSKDGDEQVARNKLLGNAIVKGHCVETGIRYSSTGKKVLITDAVLFNLITDCGVYAGQAVIIEDIKHVD
eukprot:CAMPEP_0196592020 /NCGR_PEP_ID=MMETSP1081-20130531/71589_1 /TAXON_ID=36882 /ORGANISM="Pyramimonas amylifera, Strain CCMP720" /LENGTH=133 /DNA_ID=CAMNT_0041915575 /DNA_START=586 /DNA_END=987 /DNA_ORIENTATION=+